MFQTNVQKQMHDKYELTEHICKGTYSWNFKDAWLTLIEATLEAWIWFFSSQSLDVMIPEASFDCSLDFCKEEEKKTSKYCHVNPCFHSNQSFS